jgi:quercetin dioxygenase-like cupin family protein
MADLLHPSRIVDGNTKPWIRLPKSDANIKILAIDEVNSNVMMLIKMAEGSSYPNHIHHCIAIAYTLEGSWEYDEGKLTPGVVAYEPDQSTHAPLVGPGGATVFVVLVGKDGKFIDFLRDNGEVAVTQDIEYFKTLERHADTGEPLPADFGRGVANQAPV